MSESRKSRQKRKYALKSLKTMTILTISTQQVLSAQQCNLSVKSLAYKWRNSSKPQYGSINMQTNYSSNISVIQVHYTIHEVNCGRGLVLPIVMQTEWLCSTHANYCKCKCSDWKKKNRTKTTSDLLLFDLENYIWTWIKRLDQSPSRTLSGYHCHILKANVFLFQVSLQVILS